MGLYIRFICEWNDDGHCVPIDSCIAGHMSSEDHAACVSMAAYEGLVEQNLHELTKDWDLY